jgi:hypothetical protein
LGLRYVSQIKSLEYLSIVDTHVSDVGLAHVANLTNVRYLNVGSSSVSDTRSSQLVEQNPQLVLRKDGAFKKFGKGVRWNYCVYGFHPYRISTCLNRL